MTTATERLQMGLTAADMLAADLEQRAKKIREVTDRVRVESDAWAGDVPTLVWTNVNRMVMDEMSRFPSTVHFTEHMIAGGAGR